MSYAVYTTKGWILGSVPSGEASKTYLIYTEDFGLIRAKAQSVRLLASKLRYNLSEYGLGVFSFVKGKEYWRLTQAEKIELPDRRDSTLVRARVLTLVRRLVQGEEKNENLFAVLSRLVTEENISETGIVSEVLGALGYLDTVALAGKGEKDIILAINKALKETQL